MALYKPMYTIVVVVVGAEFITGWMP